MITYVTPIPSRLEKALVTTLSEYVIKQGIPLQLGTPKYEKT